jgi:deoxyribodipyrimidine photo-lyase
MTQTPIAFERKSILAQLQGCFLGEQRPNTLTGGRSEALRLLRAYDPASYGRTRNFLAGNVSHLSPYFRHGMISPVETVDYIRANYTGELTQIEEFFRQLAWRDFFEKVLSWYGRGLDEDLEEPKHGVKRSDRLPLDVVQGETALPCMDGMLQQLFAEGYLHNHERLWFAAYLCHFRGVRWQEGARLFRQYLYDGDVASNSASWQWVEGTFASKPYFMNRENIAKFSDGRWCNSCRVRCPFDADYPTLQHKLFGGSIAPLASKVEPPITRSSEPPTLQPIENSPLPRSANLVWIHDAALSWDDPALKANPSATAVFVFDRPALLAEPWAYHRLAFILDGLEDLYLHLPNQTKLVLVGDLAEQLVATARKIGAATIHLTEHPNPWVVETVEQLRQTYHVVVHPRPCLSEYAEEPKRFSRYWEKVAKKVLGYKPKSSRRWHT